MKHIKTLLAVLAASALFAACDMSDFNDINVSPNASDQAYTRMLFLNASTYVPDFIMNRTSNSYDQWIPMINGYIAPAKNDQFHALTATQMFSTASYYYYPIKDLTTIIEMNQDENQNKLFPVTSFIADNETQIGVAVTLRAYFYKSLADILGPIVYSEALQGESQGNWKPKYDDPKEVYESLFDELESAYQQMNESTRLSSSYDIFFGGNIARWKKFNASLRMMMAIKLQDADPEQGRTRFAKAYSDGAMEDNNDSFTYTYDNRTLVSPFYRIGSFNNPSRNRNYTANSAIVDSLKAYNDNRIFTYFTIGDDAYWGSRVPEGGSATDMQYFYGIPFGIIGNANVTAAKDTACSVTQRYCDQTATYDVISATRTLLVEAEAAELGWISADPKELYEQAIRLSFENLNATGVDEYIAQEKVQLSSDKATAINQIVMQRWLAGFLNDGIETWSDWRIHNMPKLDVGDNPRSNGIEVFPYRLRYQSDDKETNQDNVDAAINAYLGGNDDRWTRIWWDVADNI